MNLASSGHLPQRGGSKAWLLSPKLGPDATLPRCLSFSYYMYERTIDPAGPSLGSLRVHVLRDAAPGLFSLQTVWRLNNHQVRRSCLACWHALTSSHKNKKKRKYERLFVGANQFKG